MTLTILYLLLALLVCLWAAWSCWRNRPGIPRREIDAETRRILVDYPDDPVAEAAARVQRLQWSKNERTQIKARRVLENLRQYRF